MKSWIVASCLAAVLVGSQESAPRGRPDLAGRWAADPALGDREPIVPICNRECVITQTTDTILVRSAQGVVITYKFDGSATHPPPREGGAPPTTLTFRTNWKGDVLVIDSTAGKYKTTARLSLAAGRLTIEGERPYYTPQPTFKQTYRKVVEKF